MDPETSVVRPGRIGYRPHLSANRPPAAREPNAAREFTALQPGAQPRRLIVCHPELLLGSAISAALTEYGPLPEVVTSCQQLLSRLNQGYDLALVSDLLGSDLRELLDALRYRRASLPVLVLTRHPDLRAAAEALEWGAVGSVNEVAYVSVVRRAVQDAYARRAVFLDGRGSEIIAELDGRASERAAARAVLARLNAREHAVLESLTAGATAREIAGVLSLSPHTIRACIRTVGDKIGARGQLRIAASARHLIDAAAPPSEQFLLMEREIREIRNRRPAAVRAC